MTGQKKATITRRGMLGTSAAMAAGLATMPFGTVRAQSHQHWGIEVDVVVVGAGTSGIPAALEAARAGSKVLLLEKVEIPGGNCGHSAGIMYLGGGTALQKKHGFEDSPEQMYAYLSAFMEPWEDTDFLKLYCDNSVAHYDWLVSQGVVYGPDYREGKVISPPDGSGGLAYSGNEPNYPYAQITPPVPRGHIIQGMGAGMANAFVAQAEAEPNITMHTSAPVTNLVVDDTKRVIGVVAKIDGQEVHVLARKGVVLASGGYEMNPEMLSRTRATQFDLVPQGSAYRGNTGDGIRMAASLGARLRNMDLTFSTPFAYPPTEKVASVLINGTGRRFANEASYGAVLGNEVVEHHNKVAWLLMDKSIADSVVAAGGNIAEPHAQADTLAELAVLLDVPAAVLENEIAFYNAHAANGEDPVYRKGAEYLKPLATPPYLAFNFTKAVPFLTVGHVEIDIDTHVLDQYGQKIAGLYAVGQNGAGIGRRFYNSGIRLGEATFFGRIAGQTVAQADPWQGETFSIVPSGLASAHTGHAAIADEDTQVTLDGSWPRVTLEAVDIAYTEKELRIPANTDVVIAMTNAGVMPHDVAVDGTDFISPMARPGDVVEMHVNLPAGTYEYYCTVPGHRQVGMIGTLIAE